MNICKCYEKIDSKIGLCNGTKEREYCDCKGNESKCDFYDYIREKAEKQDLKVRVNSIIGVNSIIRENSDRGNFINKLIICDKQILELDKDWYVDDVFYDDAKQAKDIDVLHLTIKRK